jgi:S-formylglutathione hydrolase FrmB
VILVAIDTHTVTGSTYFAQSNASGDWMRLLETMVAHVDARFRTRTGARWRGLIGQSTGGFNALTLGFRRTDLFSVIGASAPDGPAFSSWLLSASGRLREPWLTWMRFEASLARSNPRQQGQFISYAADWSPVPGDALYEWPFDLTTGEVRPAIWRAWVAQSPTGLLDDAKRAAAVRSTLSGRIFLTVARGDEFGLFEPSAALSRTLDALSIKHTFAPREGGHGAGEDERLGEALRFALRIFEAQATAD